MEIATNTTQHATTYTPTKHKDSSSHDKPFHQYMNKGDYVEVTNKTQTATYSKDTDQTKSESYDPKKEFLNFLDENLPGFFEKNGIPKEDEEAIRKVLADNLITEAEAKQLSFEQAQIIYKMQFNHFEYSLKGSDKISIIPFENNFIGSILVSTVYTNDDTFNKAIHKTLVENYSSVNDNDALAELNYTLKQAYTGMDIGFNFHQAPTPFGILQEFENSGVEIDYEKHLLKILDHADNSLEIVKDPSIRKYLGDVNKIFGLILNNYKELTENENK